MSFVQPNPRIDIDHGVPIRAQHAPRDKPHCRPPNRSGRKITLLDQILEEPEAGISRNSFDMAVGLGIRLLVQIPGPPQIVPIGAGEVVAVYNNRLICKFAGYPLKDCVDLVLDFPGSQLFSVLHVDRSAKAIAERHPKVKEVFPGFLPSPGPIFKRRKLNLQTMEVGRKKRDQRNGRFSLTPKMIDFALAPRCRCRECHRDTVRRVASRQRIERSVEWQNPMDGIRHECRQLGSSGWCWVEPCGQRHDYSSPESKSFGGVRFSSGALTALAWIVFDLYNGK